MAKYFKHLRYFLVLAIFNVFIFSICSANSKNSAAENLNSEEISIRSFDETTIDVVLKKSKIKQEPVFIFVNDYQEKKEKWEPLVQQIANRNFSVIQYDLREFSAFARGSRKLENNDYEYRPAYFLQDLDKIVLFLDINHGIKNNQIVLIGAGLGANIVLKFAAGNKDIKSVILIAPKKEEKQVSTKAAIRSYGDRPIMFLSSMNDKESYDTCLDYMSYLSRNKNVRLKFYYFDKDKKPMDFLQEKMVLDDIMDWIGKYYK